MKIRKLLTLIMVFVLTFTMVACSSKNTAQETKGENNDITQGADATEITEEASDVSNENLVDIIPKETVTLNVYDQLANYSGEQIGWFGKILLDKFNVKINIIPDSEGTYETRMESGDLGDIVIWGDNTAEYYQAIDKGMLFNLEDEDIINTYAPNIVKNCSLALETSKKLSGGNIYAVPGLLASSRDIISDFQYAWHIRWDLYEQIGKPEVKNLDDMVNVLEQIQKICPTNDNGNPTYAVSMFSDWDGDTVNFPADLVKAYYGIEGVGFGFYDPNTTNYYNLFNDDSHYIEALRFYNKLYQKGLVDPDSQTQGWDGFLEDMKNGTGLWNTISWMAGDQYNTPTHLEAGKGMYPLIPKEAKPLNWGQNPGGTDKRIYTIGAKTEYPELCMAIINWLYTPEGVLTTSYGPKDVCWVYENGKTKFTDLGKLCSKDSQTELTGDYSGTFVDGQSAINCPSWSPESINPETDEPYLKTRWASEKTVADSEIEQKWRDYSGFDTAFDYITSGKYSVMPGVTYSQDSKSDELTVTWNQVAECIKTNSWKAIYASSDTEFDSIIKTMENDAKSYGFDTCIEFIKKNLQYRIDAEAAAKAE